MSEVAFNLFQIILYLEEILFILEENYSFHILHGLLRVENKCTSIMENKMDNAEWFQFKFNQTVLNDVSTLKII